MFKNLINIWKFDWCDLGVHDYKLISSETHQFSAQLRKASARLGNYNSKSIKETFECKKCKKQFNHRTLS